MSSVRLLIPWIAVLAGAAAGMSPGRPHQMPAGGQAPPPPAAQDPLEQSLDRTSREWLEVLRSAIQEDDRARARELLQEAIEGLEDPPPGRELEHFMFLTGLDQLAEELGSLDASLHLWEEVVRLQGKRLPTDAPDVLRAKGQLAGARYRLGDLTGARELMEEVVAGFARLASPDDDDVLTTKSNLAVLRMELGDLEGACVLEEEVLAARTRLLPATHPDVLIARQNLAVTRKALGDLEGARELFEEVLATRRDVLPASHPEVLAAKENVATLRYALDDLAGAEVLLEEVLAARSRLLLPDHPDVLKTKQNLAVIRKRRGDLEGAEELFEEVLAVQERSLPADHPWLLKTRQDLAVTRKDLGDPESAREMLEEVLAARSHLAPHDPDLLTVKGNLAATRRALGDLEGARELEEEVLAARRVLPPGHPDLLLAEKNLAQTRKELGDVEGAFELTRSLVAGIRVRAREFLAEAPRPAREGARAELRRFARALSLSEATDPEGTLNAELLATLEELRAASVASSEAAHALSRHPELAELARAVAGHRARLNDLVSAGEEDGDTSWREEILKTTEARDRAEHELRSTLSAAGVFLGEIEASALGARLAAGELAVSYLHYHRCFQEDPATHVIPACKESYLAFVVQPGGRVQRVELGAAAEIEALVTSWRQALGRPLEGRGAEVLGSSGPADGFEAAGTRLRERVLDPVIQPFPEVDTLYVVPDDVLHLVPLDALPAVPGLVGERLSVRNEITLARLLRSSPPVDPAGAMILCGGIDYDAEPGSGAPELVDAATPPTGGSPTRSLSGASGFSFLPGSAEETAAIAKLYLEAFDREAVALTQASATKAAVFAAAPGTRFLHLATHGWFAGDTFRSQLQDPEERSAGEPWERVEETLGGFAPETLCGLALAGANRGRDARGRVPGILTAEELAALDLRSCELAVLSACDTSVGVRRAGQGIQSLQTALHAAGARTAITSLWKVDDTATRRLFELFYAVLWREGRDKAEALWQAKMALRAEGRPPVDWAGWVLTGDPE